MAAPIELVRERDRLLVEVNMGPEVGLEGTGNRNVILGNAFRGTNTLTGFGNVLLYNVFQP